VTRTLSTRWRLSLLAMVAVAPALAIADCALLLTLSGIENSQVKQDLVAQSSLLQAGIDDSNGRVSFGAAGGGAGPLTGSAVIVSGGRVLTSAGTDPLPAATAIAIARQAGRASVAVFVDASDRTGAPQRVYATPLSADQGVSGILVVSRSIAALQASQLQTLLIAMALSLATVVITGLIARWLAGRVLRPVRTLAGLARSISEKDLHRRIDVAAPADELGELVVTLNEMLSRLQRAFDGLQRFTADASHELRAPLAIMRAELEVSLGRQRTASDYRQSQRRLLREVRHLTDIADRLLLLARADAGTLQPEREPVDITDLVTEAVERWRPTAKRRRVALTADAALVGTVPADPALLRQVLDNLVSNALRHTPLGTSVTVRATSTQAGVELEVADSGPGVPADLRPLLFDRFFRASSARTPGSWSGGAGLGLSVSWSIARAHGGDLTYVASDQGAVFRLRLPIVVPSSPVTDSALHGEGSPRGVQPIRRDECDHAKPSTS